MTAWWVVGRRPFCDSPDHTDGQSAPAYSIKTAGETSITSEEPAKKSEASTGQRYTGELNAKSSM